MKLALSLLWKLDPKPKTLNKKYSLKQRVVYVFLKVTPPPQVGGTYFGGMALPYSTWALSYTELVVPNQRSAGTWFWVGTKISPGSMKLCTPEERIIVSSMEAISTRLSE
jgi:hypothetical protein